MRPDSPSSHHDSPTPSDAEDYPVWRRWGDLDKHVKGPSEPDTELEESRAPAPQELDAPRTNGDIHQETPPVEAVEMKDVESTSEDVEFSALDIRDRVVIMLLFKQIVQIEDVEAAWRRYQDRQPGRSREPLWRILARDPRFERDRILAEAARTAGYDEAKVDPDEAAAFLNSYFHTFSENDWERMLELSLVPVAREVDVKSGRERFVFITPDPTRPGVPKLMRDLKLDRYVLRFASEALIDGLLADLTGRGLSIGSADEAVIAPDDRTIPDDDARVRPDANAEWTPELQLEPIDEEPVAAETQPEVEQPEEPESDHHVMDEIEAIILAGNSQEGEAEDPVDPEEDAGSFDEEGLPDVERPVASNAATPVQELFEALLVEAVRTRASGIHLLPAEDGLRIDMRVEGELRTWKSCPRSQGDELVSVVKESALNIKPTELDSIQDGVIRRRVGDTSVQFSVSILPIAGGWNQDRRESVVISTIGNSTSSTDLAGLGLPEEVLDHLKTSTAELGGMIVLTGPSGSGRSQTLNAILQEIVTSKVNVITLEESVSFPATGIRQVRLSHKLDHEDALEAVRRHDPDIILVGELRTREAAELTLKLANTGPLVLARMPVHDTSGVIGRLFRMGVDPFLIGYAIKLVVAQRLVRRLCAECRRPATHIDGELLHRLGFARGEIASTTFYEEGEIAECPSCGGRKYDGTRIIAEAMPLSHDLRRMIALADKSLDEEDVRIQAVREGMTTLRASAREVVKQGEMSIDELIRSTAGN